MKKLDESKWNLTEKDDLLKEVYYNYEFFVKCIFPFLSIEYKRLEQNLGDGNVACLLGFKYNYSLNTPTLEIYKHFNIGSRVLLKSINLNTGTDSMLEMEALRELLLRIIDFINRHELSCAPASLTNISENEDLFSYIALNSNIKFFKEILLKEGLWSLSPLDDEEIVNILNSDVTNEESLKQTKKVRKPFYKGEHIKKHK